MNFYLDKILKNVDNIQILGPLSKPEEVLKYFKYIAKYREPQPIDKQHLINQADKLFTETDLEQKRILIVRLAGIDEVKALNILKKYQQNPDPELVDWINIAVQENTALLQSSLLDQPQILITSGLGGKDNKLRYFIAFWHKNLEPWQNWQKDLIKKEIEFAFEQFNCTYEHLEFGRFSVALTALFPIDKWPHSVVPKIIENINEIGNFIDSDILVRNDKIFSVNELEKILQHHGKQAVLSPFWFEQDDFSEPNQHNKPKQKPDDQE